MTISTSAVTPAEELAARAPDQEYLTVHELASWIGVSWATLRHWRNVACGVQSRARYSPPWYVRRAPGARYLKLCYVTSEVRDWILAHPHYVRRLGCMVKPDRSSQAPVDRGALSEIQMRMPLGYWLSGAQVCAWLGVGRVTLWHWRDRRLAESTEARDAWPPFHVGDHCLPDVKRDADGLPMSRRSGPGKPIAYMRTEVAEWLERRPWVAARVLGVRVPRRS